jgi:ketosteroid isomerase-like protein
MSEQDLETARRWYEHFIATGDVLADVLHPDFVLDMSKFRGWPERQQYEGIDGIREFITDWFGTWEEGWEFEVVELLDTDDVVVALIRHRGRSKASGVPVEMGLAHLITYRDGKQVRLQAYASQAEGLEAAGLTAER